MVQIIKDFAGGDDVGCALSANILLLEKSFGDVQTAAQMQTMKMRNHNAGFINGLFVNVRVTCWARYQQQPDANTVMRVCTNTEEGWRRLTVLEVPFGKWDFNTRRKAFAEALFVHWVQEQCKYCARLVETEGCCDECVTKINEFKCHFCASTCGRMVFKKLKRGRGNPKEHFHAACKKRKLFHF